MANRYDTYIYMNITITKYTVISVHKRNDYSCVYIFC